MNEHDMQVSIMQEVALRANLDPVWGLLFAIPNGGQRSKATAGKLKAEGVRAGVPDLCWPIARGAYHGLFIELKVGKNRQRPSQMEWMAQLTEQGYCHLLVRDSADRAMQLLEWYYNGANQ